MVDVYFFFLFSRINGPKLIARNYFLTASRNEQTAVKSPSKRRKEERFGIARLTIAKDDLEIGFRKEEEEEEVAFSLKSNYKYYTVRLIVSNFKRENRRKFSRLTRGEDWEDRLIARLVYLCRCQFN